MGRKKNNVEGITLDLPDGVDCDIIALLEAAQNKIVLTEPKVPLEKKKFRKLTTEELQKIVSNITHRCEDCSNSIMYIPRIWGKLKICHSCHKKRLLPISEEINRYLAEKGHISCNFCNKIRTDPSEFHLDHINMFSKTGSVGSMMYNGHDIDNIKKEIDKCQLLCISCHAAVTHLEHRYGFIKAKKAKKKCNIEHIENMYDEYMAEVYSLLKSLHGK